MYEEIFMLLWVISTRVEAAIRENGRLEQRNLIEMTLPRGGRGRSELIEVSPPTTVIVPEAAKLKKIGKCKEEK